MILFCILKINIVKKIMARKAEFSINAQSVMAELKKVGVQFDGRAGGGGKDYYALKWTVCA